MDNTQPTILGTQALDDCYDSLWLSTWRWSWAWKRKRCFCLGKSGKQHGKYIKTQWENLCWEDENIAYRIARQLAWNTQNRSLVDDFPLPKKWFSDFIVVFRSVTCWHWLVSRTLASLRCKCLTTHNPGSTKVASTQKSGVSIQNRGKTASNILQWSSGSHHFSGISFDDQKVVRCACS